LSIPEEGLKNHYTDSEFTVAFWVKVSNMTAKNAVFHQGVGPGATYTDPVPRQSWFRLDTSGKTVVFCVEYREKQETGLNMKVNEWMTVSGITMYVFIRKWMEKEIVICI
jgi:hypothetical protein